MKSNGRLKRLLQGARHFRERVFPIRKSQFEALAKGQNPVALFITCADSRISPEMITHAEPGDLFVCRNIGNIVPKYGDMLGGVSAVIEYAVTALKVDTIIICGHSDCGAMKALRDPEAKELDAMPTVRNWLSNALEARDMVHEHHGDLEGDHYTQALVEQNVLLQMKHLRSHPAVAAGIEKGNLQIYGWVYGIEDGRIEVFDHGTTRFIPIEKLSARFSGRNYRI
ncbi:carbonic anhydrase [Granulibacter bethesdensis]|uniref:Carbonic anhydrase n=2 Tax=Granulibacter bethesdensis TaxID=364410 RepID=Q0BW48_GRABC|nr:carbonic anhydrase [Granulibacter bethesdensis]ABI60954.1 Carbonic anhydrase [Granulibacter bethesdensis CGDNIH1]AHJ61794.1 Carbonic anhydrase [Granulibacter bethesdensis]AHJ64417.1 Carbonic anhydrase [Granulibacter bethesdensis CGDNIH4]AHJ67038.1 Carbonic anhydrase [Granulibacter bethesdensis]APH50721.1 Carbonic anhydrase [Granulibacter bethesdensis]